MYQDISQYKDAHKRAEDLMTNILNTFVESLEKSSAKGLQIEDLDGLEFAFADMKIKCIPFPKESVNGRLPAVAIYKSNKYWPEQGLSLVTEIYFNKGLIKPQDILDPDYQAYLQHDETSIYYFMMHLLGRALGITKKGA